MRRLDRDDRTRNQQIMQDLVEAQTKAARIAAALNTANARVIELRFEAEKFRTEITDKYDLSDGDAVDYAGRIVPKRGQPRRTTENDVLEKIDEIMTNEKFP